MTDQGNELAFLYLDADDVVALYAEIFDCTVDEAGDQLRSRSGLEGAVARPRTHAAYGRGDLALQAAVLAHGIAESQVFVDGNERTALIALLTFLDINGWMLDTDDVEASQILWHREQWYKVWASRDPYDRATAAIELSGKRPCCMANKLAPARLETPIFE